MKKIDLELNSNNYKKDKGEAIWDSFVYPNKLKSGQLQRLYYLIF